MMSQQHGPRGEAGYEVATLGATHMRLIKRKEACAILGCGPTHLYSLARTGHLRPVKLTALASRWVEAEVRAYATSLVAERDAACSSAPARSAA